MAYFTGISLNLESVGLNGNTLSHSTDLEEGIHTNRVIHIQGNVGPVVGFETGCFHLDLEASNGKFGGVVTARCVGLHGTDESLVQVCNRDSCVGNDRTCGVGHRPYNGGGSLTVCCGAQQHNRENKQHGYAQPKTELLISG
jgi:hypothetical protein